MARQNDSPSTAVERTLLILEAAAQREGGMSNAEFSRKLKIPKSSASYILRTLEQHGYLRRDGEDGRYRLGMKVLSLSRAALSGVDVREVALPIMRQLVDHIHITTHLAILDHGEAVYVEKVEAPSFIKMNTWIGRRMEVHSTAVGKALLAYLDPERARRHPPPARPEEADAAHHHQLPQADEGIRARAHSWAMRWTMKRTAWARVAWARPSSTAEGTIEAAIASTGTINDVPHEGGAAPGRHGEGRGPPHLAPDRLSRAVSEGSG